MLFLKKAWLTLNFELKSLKNTNTQELYDSQEKLWWIHHFKTKILPRHFKSMYKLHVDFLHMNLQAETWKYA